MVSPAVTHAQRVEAVVVGGSAGSVYALGEILPALPPDFPTVLVVVHIPATPRTFLVELFGPRCAMRVREPDAFEPLARGCIYIAPADYHMLVEPDGRCSLSVEPAVNLSRPAIDVLFESAAVAYGPRLAAVVLTGGSDDGARGLRAIRSAGGVAIVQDPATASTPVMPAAALAAVPDALILPLHEIPSTLRSLAS